MYFYDKAKLCCSLKKISLKMPDIPMKNFDPQMWPFPTPDGHDFNKIEYTLPENVSMLNV